MGAVKHDEAESRHTDEVVVQRPEGRTLFDGDRRDEQIHDPESLSGSRGEDLRAD